MFGFLKLSGAPPRAFKYYRSTKDPIEKAILEDLYEEYDNFVKEEELEFNRIQKLISINGVSGYDDASQKAIILSGTYDKLTQYGNSKGYSEFLISLFYQGY